MPRYRICTKVPLRPVEDITELFELPEEANKLIAERFPMNRSEYTPFPCDEKGNLIEEVDDDTVTRARKDANWILQNNHNAAMCFKGLLLARRLHATMVMDLQGLVRSTIYPAHGGRPLEEYAADMLIDAAGAEANKQFDLIKVLHDLTQFVEWFHSRMSATLQKEEPPPPKILGPND